MSGLEVKAPLKADERSWITGKINYPPLGPLDYKSLITYSFISQTFNSGIWVARSEISTFRHRAGYGLIRAGRWTQKHHSLLWELRNINTLRWENASKSPGIHHKHHKLHGCSRLIPHSQICLPSRIISELFLFVFTGLALASHGSSCLMNWVICSRIASMAAYLPGLIHHALIGGRGVCAWLWLRWP